VVGNTPLIRLQRLGASINPTNKIYIKMEGSNPGGSSKDRSALNMLNAAERSGRLRPGGRVIECSTGMSRFLGSCLEAAHQTSSSKLLQGWARGTPMQAVNCNGTCHPPRRHPGTGPCWMLRPSAPFVAAR
jgi:hypothetical protein